MKSIRLVLMTAAALMVGTTTMYGQTLTTLYSFTGSSDGDRPIGILEGSDGNFYGATLFGGTNSAGTVFRINPSGSLTTIYTFKGSDGQNPVLNFLDNDGNLYGTTLNLIGGAGKVSTVFRMSTNGTLTTLHTFTLAEGSPSGLVRGSDTNFYCTTATGGYNGVGAVYRLSPSGTLTRLRSFNGIGGSAPAGLWVGKDGNLYGVTSQGGSSASCFNGCGTVFSISLTGSFATLCSFSDSNGSRPTGIVPGNDGNFYGATASGGSGTNCVSGCGTVFRVTAGGTLTTLYSFEGSDGQTAALGIQGRDDDFYGFTASGGSNSVGTLFRISPSGSLTTLYSFKGSDGGSPTSIVQGSDGAFYGTTGLGGTNNHGTVFKLTVPTSAAQHQITGIQLSETNVIITLSTVAGAGYQLQSKDVLSTGAWSNVGASITSAGGALIVTNVGGAFFTQRFYRFSITP